MVHIMTPKESTPLEVFEAFRQKREDLLSLFGYGKDQEDDGHRRYDSMGYSKDSEVNARITFELESQWRTDEQEPDGGVPSLEYGGLLLWDHVQEIEEDALLNPESPKHLMDWKKRVAYEGERDFCNMLKSSCGEYYLVMLSDEPEYMIFATKNRVPGYRWKL
jgi:hypothetical protein